jgi:hypothetical protein
VLFANAFGWKIPYDNSVGKYVWEDGSMKMTFSILIILLAMVCTVPASACSLQKDKETGGACSIKDIKKVENQRMQEKVIFKSGKNLRPVKVSPEIKNPDEESCIFCLQKVIFGEKLP